MPGIVMLPFMMIELCAYGLFAGLLRNVKLPTIAKVAAVQIADRAVLARNGIQPQCDVSVKNIINRTDTGICPMEEAVRDITISDEALKSVRRQLNKFFITCPFVRCL